MEHMNQKESIIKISELQRNFKTYKRGSGFKESVKSFFHREEVLVEAVKQISFEVKTGSITGILGPNGAGKSTLIKMMTGTLYPTSGLIDVLGYVPSKNRSKYVNHIGAVFGQKSQLIWDIPPIDSFRMNKAIYDIKDEDYNNRLAEMTELFELTDIVGRPTRVLSLGERMKCEFIMAMLHKPEIVFLDEPTIGLDIIAKQKIRSFIKNLNESGTTFILTTHDLQDVEELADQIIIINHGTKVFDSSIEALKSKLGTKKIIHVVTKNPMSKITMNGVNELERESDCNLMLELDTSILPTHNFIRDLSNTVEFLDISIKELPMEQIITKIYTE